MAFAIKFSLLLAFERPLFDLVARHGGRIPTQLKFLGKTRMLVLSRCKKERIAIGDNIFITVLGIEGGRVRIGIEAPASVPIRRTELLARLAGAGVSDLQPNSVDRL